MRLFTGSEAARSRSRWQRLGIGALIAFLTPQLMLAQGGGSIAGTVIVESSGAPLPGVQIGAGTRGASSDVSGHFRINGLSGDSVTIVVRRLGYSPIQRTVAVGNMNIALRMRERAVELNNIVVTGTPGAVSQRELGVSVDRVQAADVVRTQPVQDVQGLINGRAPGVTVLENSGVVGSGATIRIRGGSSLSLSNQPLIYVDGVRVDNAQGTGPPNQSFGASTTTRWNDFDPDDIQSIEIVKGPAATALYGTDAVNGVVQIITKKGSAGKARWDLTSRQGESSFANYVSRFPTNYAMVNGVLESENIAQIREDSGKPMFRSGRINDNTLAVSGGAQNLQYRVSGDSKSDQGVEPTNWQTQYGSRGNILFNPSSTVQIATSAGYVRGITDLSVESGYGGTMYSGFYATPTKLGTPSAGFRSGTPEAYWEEYKLDQLFNRFTGSVMITHTPSSWFSHQLTIGTDFGHEQDDELAGVHHDLSYFFGSDADSGYKNVNYRDNTLNTFTYHATVTASPTSSLKSTTVIGSDYYLNNTRYSGGSGSDFPAPGLTALSSTTAGKSGYEYSRDNNSLGIFGQEELAWRERVYAQFGMRSDQHSSFGSNFKNVVYPHVSLSWVLSDEPFFADRVPFFSALKLRGAYGQSGEAPPPFVSVQSYQATATGVTPYTIGNPNLEPERGYETELGFDAGFLHDRAGIEFTYYNGGTRNEILQIPVAPSTGFGVSTQYVNAGRILRHGIEMTLRATPIQTATTSWDMTYNFSTNNTKVDYLGGNQFLVASTYIENRIGYPLYSWFGRQVSDRDGRYGAQQGDEPNVLRRQGRHGGVRECARRVSRPLASERRRDHSRPACRFLTNFRIAGMLDFKSGYKKLNGDERVRCHIYSSASTTTTSRRHRPRRSARSRSVLAVSATSIQDASFVKLRELSLTWTVPQTLVRHMNVARRVDHVRRTQPSHLDEVSGTRARSVVRGWDAWRRHSGSRRCCLSCASTSRPSTSRSDHEDIIPTHGGKGGDAATGWLAAIAIAGPIAACNNIHDALNVTAPDQISAKELSGPAYATLLVNSAVGDFECAYGAFVVDGALMSGELQTRRRPLRGGRSTDAISSRTRASTRVARATRSACTRRSRQRASTQIQSPRFSPAGPTHRWRTGRICSRKPTSTVATIASCSASCSARRHIALGPELTPAQVFALAEAKFTAGLAAAQAAGDQQLIAFAYAGRARARRDQGNLTGADADAHQVPAGFVAYATADASELRATESRVRAVQRPRRVGARSVPGTSRYRVRTGRRCPTRGFATRQRARPRATASTPLIINTQVSVGKHTDTRSRATGSAADNR